MFLKRKEILVYSCVPMLKLTMNQCVIQELPIHQLIFAEVPMMVSVLHLMSGVKIALIAVMAAIVATLRVPAAVCS